MRSKNQVVRAYRSWIDTSEGIQTMIYYALNLKDAQKMHRARGGIMSASMTWNREQPSYPSGTIIRYKIKKIHHK